MLLLASLGGIHYITLSYITLLYIMLGYVTLQQLSNNFFEKRAAMFLWKKLRLFGPFYRDKVDYIDQCVND